MGYKPQVHCVGRAGGTSLRNLLLLFYACLSRAWAESRVSIDILYSIVDNLRNVVLY